MPATLVQFPERDIQDLPRGLRALADAIESGQYGDAHNLAWVCDCGNGDLQVGYLGKAAEVGISCYFLLGLGMRRIENI